MNRLISLAAIGLIVAACAAPAQTPSPTVSLRPISSAVPTPTLPPATLPTTLSTFSELADQSGTVARRRGDACHPRLIRGE